MGPNARSVLSALKRMGELPEITTIATGHGPLLHYNVTELTNRRQWSQEQAKAETTVAVFMSDYGFSDRLSQAIAHGITKTGVAVEMMDLKVAEPQDVKELVSIASVGDWHPPTTGLLLRLLSAFWLLPQLSSLWVCLNLRWDSESVYPLLNKFRFRAGPAFPPILVKETPREATYQMCEEAGTDQWLCRDRSIKQIKALNTDLEKPWDDLAGCTLHSQGQS